MWESKFKRMYAQALEPDNEPLSSRARTPLGTTRQLTAKRSQYNQPERNQP